MNGYALSEYLGMFNKDDMKLLYEGLSLAGAGVPTPAPGYVELTDCFECGLVGKFLAGAGLASIRTASASCTASG